MSTRSCVASGITAAVAFAAWGTAANAVPIEVRVYYQSRACLNSPQLGVLTLVTAGKVIIRRGNDAPVVVTLSDTPAKVTLDGTDPLHAMLLLETPRIQVVQATGGVLAESISLGTGVGGAKER